ncbi:MAG: tRNA (adenosine(37)-N6)-threonylcarbamoyltransferase complex dimerization subunit type 1 TsaB [Alphaproteobacteria bacterium]|nr:tRNA (adenosine(37)-N6)-threonylcarbamoyltransferase complex dimerization subunit type 1 TsaB [Alphaproteobacteria bacterium]
MKLLAFDTSTEQLHLGASDGSRHLTHAETGGPQSSQRILPLALSTLGDLGLTVGGLDAIVMGRGPGSFTGLRTACAVAQGLAYAAKVPVLPIDTLWAVAEEARQGRDSVRVLAVLDARMGQYYVAAYQFAGGHWTEISASALLNPDQVLAPSEWLMEQTTWILAGLGFEGIMTQLQTQSPQPFSVQTAAPTAAALMRLAPQAWVRGEAVAAELAMPMYVRDKVAQTTAEREAGRLT